MLASTPDVAVHGDRLPLWKPPFWINCGFEHELLELIVQVNEADPEAPVVSVAVTVTLLVPAVVGVPVIRPEEEMVRPAGSPLAV